MNPHNRLVRLGNPPVDRWECQYCYLVGTYDELLATECSYIYPPCKYCSRTPLCAPDCPGIIKILADPDVDVISDYEDPTPNPIRCNPGPYAYKYLGQCDRLRLRGHEALWSEMIRQKVPVCMEHFEQQCDLSSILDEDESLSDFIAGDPTSEFYASFWGAQKCLFIQTHGFEFIFVES